MRRHLLLCYLPGLCAQVVHVLVRNDTPLDKPFTCMLSCFERPEPGEHGLCRGSTFDTAAVGGCQDPVVGSALLFTYTLGYVAPLLAAASFTGALKQLLELRKFSAWINPARSGHRHAPQRTPHSFHAKRLCFDVLSSRRLFWTDSHADCIILE